MVKALVMTGLVLMAIIALTACQGNQIHSRQRPVEGLPASPFPLVVNVTCAPLAKSNQTFNVSGFLTSVAPVGDKVFLFIAPDPSYQTVVDVVDQCPPVMASSLSNHKYFRFEGLPPGLYVASVPGKAFLGHQGFPMFRTLNDTGTSGNVSIKWHGGDVRHSLLVFSVEPTEQEGGA